MVKCLPSATLSLIFPFMSYHFFAPLRVLRVLIKSVTCQKLLTRNDEVRRYGKNKQSAFWRNRYEDPLHRCMTKDEQNCVFANILSSISCRQMNKERWDTCIVLIFEFECTFRILFRILWRSTHREGWQSLSIFRRCWWLFWVFHSKCLRGRGILLSCSIHERIDTH